MSKSRSAKWRLYWRAGAAALIAGTILMTVTAAAPSGAARRHAALGYNPNATVVVGFQFTDVPTLDPAFFPTAWSPFNDPIYDTLMQTDPLYTKVRPMLASSWGFNKAGTTFTVNLRPGIKFHGGAPVDAAAVKANIVRFQTLPGSLQTRNLAAVASVSVVSKYVVRFNLVHGLGANLPWLLCGSTGMVINPADFHANLAQDPQASVGSGSYVFNSQPAPGTEFIFKRAPGKPWQAGTGLAKTLEVIATNSSPVGISAVQSNTLQFAEIDVASIGTAAKVIKNNPKTYAGPTYIFTANNRVELNPKVAPFTNVLYRKAVQAALNPAVFANDEGGGSHACTLDSQPVGPNYPTYDKNFVNSNPYNPTQAKKYLAEAGVPNGFSFNMDFDNASQFPITAQLAQSELAQVGITVNLVPFSAINNQPNFFGGKWQAYAYGGSSETPDPVTALFPQLLTGGPSLTVGTPLYSTAVAYYKQMSNPKLSQAGLNSVSAKFFKWLNDQAVNLMFCEQNAIFIYRVGLLHANPTPFPSGIQNPQYFADT